MNINEMVAALEAVLFAGGEPVSSARLCEVFEIDDETLSKLLKMLSLKWNKNKGCYYLYFKIAETIDFSTFSIRKKYYFT